MVPDCLLLYVSVLSAGIVITSRRQTTAAFMSTRSPTRLSKYMFIHFHLQRPAIGLSVG